MNQDTKTRIASCLLVGFLLVVITSCGGGSSPEQLSNVDVLPDTPDATPPTISYVYPAKGVSYVSTNATITVSFSEPVDFRTVTNASFLVSGPSGSIEGNVQSGGNNIAFTPSINLPYQSTISVTITSAIKDLSGNALASDYTWTFTTAVQPDTTPPTVVTTDPNDKATGVAVSAVITATLSEAMMPSTINTGTFTINNGVTGTVTYSGSKATFTPTSYLPYPVTYTATITTGVKDAAGNAMVVPYTWTFTTSSADSGKMPDTNQTACYDASGTMIACEGSGQDGAYNINPPSYTDNGNGTITDNVTGLVWQKQDDGIIKNWDDANNYCNNLSLAGQTGWRLPSLKELIGIVDYGAYNPSINTLYFPLQPNKYFWSATRAANSVSAAQGVGFTYGSTGAGDMAAAIGYARCVRSGQSQPARLVDNGNGTVTDSGTHLTWQQKGDSYFGSGHVTWETALAFCEDLTLAGQTDWRLPNIKELSTVVDLTRSRPAINTTMFPEALSLAYWSSSTEADSTSHAWIVYFDYGEFYYLFPKESTEMRGSTRCVRGGQ